MQLKEYMNQTFPGVTLGSLLIFSVGKSFTF